jgi:hypothetical protein
MAPIFRLICLLISVGVLGGCAAGPAPLKIHDTPRESIWIMFDPHAGAGHSHPAEISTVQMAQVLSGIRVKSRDAFGLGGLLGKGSEGIRAFGARDITLLAQYLPEALRKASPKDVVTFYLTDLEPNVGRVVTSGGVFVRNGDLFFILANHRTALSAGTFEATAYELDARETPLFPMGRFRFTVGFTPNEAHIPNAHAKQRDAYDGYVDDSKLAVIALDRLAEPEHPAPAPAAPARP